jgi:hypothetical protein
MSHTQEAAQGGSGDARGRRWYHFRPKPRRRADLMGFNSRWWMVLAWVLLILWIVFPFPWWW